MPGPELVFLHQRERGHHSEYHCRELICQTQSRQDKTCRKYPNEATEPSDMAESARVSLCDRIQVVSGCLAGGIDFQGFTVLLSGLCLPTLTGQNCAQVDQCDLRLGVQVQYSS